MIKEELIFKNKTNFLQTKCCACSSKSHLAKECDLIHFVPDKIRIVKKFLKDPGQKSRISYKRSERNKYNSLFSLKYMQSRHQRFKQISFYYENYNDRESELMSPTISEPRNNLKINTNVERILESQKNFQIFKSNKMNKRTRSKSIPSSEEEEKKLEIEQMKKSKKNLIINTDIDSKNYPQISKPISSKQKIKQSYDDFTFLEKITNSIIFEKEENKNNREMLNSDYNFISNSNIFEKEGLLLENILFNFFKKVWITVKN